MSKIQVVTEFKPVRKGVVAKEIRISFKCPYCKASLLAAEEEIGAADNCPHCGKPFQLDPTAKEVFRAAERAVLRAAEKENEARLQAEEEARQQLEEKKLAAAKAEEQRLLREAATKQKEQLLQAQKESVQRLANEKAEYRQRGVRGYPTLIWLADVCTTLSVFNILASVCLLLLMIGLSYPDEVKVTLAIMIIAQTVFGWLILTVISESIRLFVNMAQDTERLLLFREAEAGKDWAK